LRGKEEEGKTSKGGGDVGGKGGWWMERRKGGIEGTEKLFSFKSIVEVRVGGKGSLEIKNATRKDKSGMAVIRNRAKERKEFKGGWNTYGCVSCG